MNASQQAPEEFEFLICDISNLWRKMLSQHTKELGITISEWRVLYAILRFPGSTQVQIAQFVDLEPQSLTRILDSLENHQWIEKQASAHDRRAKCLYTTPLAATVIAKVKQIGDTLIRPEALRDIEAQHLLTLISTLNTVKNNLSTFVDKEK